MENTGILYIVATPIGNLEDITLRAIRLLGEVDYVLCEDTRVTGRLLAHYNIKKPLKRYDAHSSREIQIKVIDDLLDGKKIALVSDAGTPGISDPGVLLVQGAREAGARIESIPGPSALTTAVALAGIAGNQFTFLGFVPHKKGRETFFRNLSTYEIQPVVFFESTHRIMKTLDSLNKSVPTATVYLGRELTKLFEEILVGTAADITTQLEAQTVKQKGEFVVIVDYR